LPKRLEAPGQTLMVKLEEKRQLENRDIDGRIVQWVLEK
jgi:hypothetical protein